MLDTDELNAGYCMGYVKDVADTAVLQEWLQARHCNHP